MKFFKRIYFYIRLLPLSGKRRAAFLKKKKYLFFQGENCNFTTIDFGTEPYLIKIHNNVEVASQVRFLTHDDSCLVVKKSLKENILLDKVGSIEIFDNCFIGANSLLMPNITIGPNSIVAAGSIVTKSVKPNSIVGGNPAKEIGKFDDYAKKLINSSKDLPWINLLNDRSKNREEIIRLRKEFYFKTKC